MQALASIHLFGIAHLIPPLFVQLDNKKVFRFMGTDTVPASRDTVTGVESQDVDISPEVMVRLYKPAAAAAAAAKLPLLVYFHGGAFCVESAQSPKYHNYLNAVSSKANVLVVSVDYRLAPEYPLPVCYDDSWAAIEWALSGDNHSWIKDHADLSKVFLGGDSSGANIAHHMAKRMGSNNKPAVKGALLVDPYFWGEERIGSEHEKLYSDFIKGEVIKLKGDELWKLIAPQARGWDDPIINPAKDPELGVVAAEKVMVCVAEQDVLRDRGYYYKDALMKSGFKGSIEMVEIPGEGHVFHLDHPNSPHALQLMDKTVAFLSSSS